MPYVITVKCAKHISFKGSLEDFSWCFLITRNQVPSIERSWISILFKNSYQATCLERIFAILFVGIGYAYCCFVIQILWYEYVQFLFDGKSKNLNSCAFDLKAFPNCGFAYFHKKYKIIFLSYHSIFYKHSSQVCRLY